MPIYEYKCRKCGRLTSVFLRSAGSSARDALQGVRLAVAGAGDVRLRLSPLRVVGAGGLGAEPKRLEDYKDPRQIGRWTERKFKEMGVDVPKEAREMIDAAREGELPDPVKDL